MGQRKSKLSKNSYNVAPTSQRSQTPPAAVNGHSGRNGNDADHVAVPQKLVAPEILERSFPQKEAVGIDEVDSKSIPTWVRQEHFVDILQQNVEGFDKITKFTAKPALTPGENYVSLMLRVGIDVQLKDNSSQHVSYMLKVSHDSEQMKQMLDFMNVFETENAVYVDIIPELEEMYKSVGAEVRFGASSYKFAKNPSPYTVLLEDLRPLGFKNANRLQGLDMEHTKAVLKKLAEFHAVSACRVATKGDFAEIFMQPFEKYKAAKHIMDGMMAGFKNQFLDNLSNYKDGPMYHQILKTQFDKLTDEWLLSVQYNPDEFNVLNHGDCWTNNVLFKYTDDGQIAETHFVDYQQPSYGSPVRDLYYFILSSVNIDIKLKHFDFFMRYYFNHLKDNLVLLKYPKRLPTLRELHTHLYKYSAWPLTTVVITLPVVLLDPTECAQFENFMTDSDEGKKFKNLMYTNDRYRSYVEQILPWLHNRGLLESNEIVEEVKPVAVEKASSIPEWVTEEYFIDVLKENVKGFKQIKKFVVMPGTNAGDNYSSTMLKVDIDVELEDGSPQIVSYMLKVAPKGEQANAILNAINIFQKEADMYNNNIPQFEQFYKDAGADISIGPKSFQFVKDPGCDTVLLENLTPLGYKNADRLAGLDMEHTKAILIKLAEFHAASAYYYATKGSFLKMYEQGIISEENREMMEKVGESFLGVAFDNMKKFTGNEEYIDKLLAMKPHTTEISINAYKVKENCFNVLNHGDLWTNNVMFQYDSEGKIKSTYFVDFAMCKYGTPAQDLYYFLLSSPTFDLKLEHFDYFVRFYHDNLAKNLKLLNYPKAIPSLKELHLDLFKNNSWAFNTVSGVLTAILLDPTENASMENMLGTHEAGIDFKNQMYSNPRYRKQAEAILPWLNRRGLLEYDEIKPKVKATTIKNTTPVPDWITEEYFIDILKQNISDFKQIKKFVVLPGTNVGDNYASLMLKVEIDVELADGSSQSVSYMLKVQPNGKNSQVMLDEINTFKKEGEMYKNIIPQFEQFYKDAGADVAFGPKSFEFVKDPGCETILLENLSPFGYKNADRLTGLDQEHTENVLIKLAEFHAASAYFLATNGAFSEIFSKGIFNPNNRELMHNLIKNFFGIFTDIAKTYNGYEEYYDKLLKSATYFVDIMIKANEATGNLFLNVLNHGDLWTNNVMFRYDAEGKIQNTFLIDYQICQYGSPAQDLYYFLISSPSLDIKLDKFDYFVRFYYEKLKHNLELLKYPNEIPSLKVLHLELLRNGVWGYSTATGVMSAILLDPTESANMENFFGEDEAGNAFRKLLYSNQRYRSHIEVILPWLNRRGLLDFDDIKVNLEAKTIKNTNPIPDWITEEYFIDILKQNISDFKQIKTFVVVPGTNVGDNYASIMLKAEIDVELSDGTSQSVSYMLKIQPTGEQTQAMLGDMSTFKKEGEMYKNIIPQFEQFYKDAGADIVFGPKSFQFVKDPGCETILLENLSPFGYKNADRFAGLDKEHTENVLSKLAEFHAASAYFLATNRELPEIFSKGVFNMDNREMMKKMTDSFYGLFYDIAKTYKGNEEYYDKILKCSPHLTDIMIKANELDGNVFLKVLNHGDLWTNNIMFRYDAEGKIQNTFLVDYQMCQLGSPAQDLYYFLMSSPALDVKLDQFDYFVRFYYENLTKNLNILKFPNKIPTLKELHMELFRNSSWGYSTATGIMCVILLEPTENANIENMLGEDETGIAFKKLMYSNQRYRSHIEAILPWLNRRGLLDFDDIIQRANLEAKTIKNTNPVPDWITEEYFIDILKQNISDFKQIKTFVVVPGTNVGDNYASIMLKAEIDVELSDGTSQSVSYMLKIQPIGEQTQAMLGDISTFKKEGEMYKNIIPQFEQFYKDAGADIVFGPKSFEFVKDPGCETILLENLRPYGYKNADRLAGLDKEHTEAVLSKLAEFHAASAYFLATNRELPEIFSKGVFNMDNREMMKKMTESFYGLFYDIAKTYKGNEEYFDKIINCSPHIIDIMIKANEVDGNVFLKVLNHGDLWTNNIMFRYDAEGKIQNTFLIDYQMCQFGSPAQDLYYFLISSPALDIKLDQFDYFVRFYYENLTKNLKILKFPNKIPTLKELHMELFRNNTWGYSTATGVMCAILLEPTENASMENMLGEDETGIAFKKLMYSNQRYRSHIEVILPWLNRRGLLDFDIVNLETETKTPAWVDEAHFADILAENIDGFSKVLRINAAPATQVGDNYASSLLVVDIVVELKDGATKSVSYMLKIPNDSEHTAEMTSLFHFFEKELTLYDQYLPEFEQMYREAGTELVFGPKHYKFKKEIPSEKLLLENLRTRKFKVNDRLQGLDQNHTESVLRKLAQFHAASVKRVQLKGAYPEIFNDGFYCEKSRTMLEELSKHNDEILEAVRTYDGHAEYQHKIPHLLDIFVDKAIECNKIDPDEFNVLNHGDSWNNNIMFQYDDAGNLQETLFVDFQICNYGSPAQDLYYLLISSTHLDIKVEQFDYFISYYHQHLIENLTLLKCSGKVPTLKDLHASLLKYGYNAINTLFGVTTVCLLEPTAGANVETFFAETAEAAAFRKKIYTNDIYKAHAGIVLPWLNKRGLLDF